jgi:hypothetical protein
MFYSDITRYENLPFADYLKLPGYSFSRLKNDRGGLYVPPNITAKMSVGSMVDEILCDGTPDEDSEIFAPCLAIAHTIRKDFGYFLDGMKKQVSFTGRVNHKGFEMQVKGRTDFLLDQYAILDLKITEATSLAPLIAFMGYDRQLTNYAGLASVPKAYILAYSTKLKKVLPLHPINVTLPNEWWADKIITFGTFKN